LWNKFSDRSDVIVTPQLKKFTCPDFEKVYIRIYPRRSPDIDTAEMEMGQWVMGQMGHHFWMGHVGHGSLPLTHDEITAQ